MNPATNSIESTVKPTADSAAQRAVAVYCASSSSVPQIYLEVAHKMGELLARGGYDLVCGGGYRGLMAASIDGALSAGGNATGVLPRFMVDRGWAHPGLTRTIITETMHERKMTMAELSCAAIALPGGIGTLDELLEIMTWHQLHLYTGHVVIVNTDGYFAPLIEMFQRMKDQGFMRNGNIHATIAATPEEAMDIISQPQRES